MVRFVPKSLTKKGRLSSNTIEVYKKTKTDSLRFNKTRHFIIAQELISSQF